MSSITRAVTSRLSEFTNGRQRLTSEKQAVTPGQFNYIIPPEIIWEEYQAQKQEPLKVEVEPEAKVEVELPEKKTSPSIFSQKMSAVVRKLSPFSDDSSSSTSKEKDPGLAAVVEDEKSAKKNGRFKETKQKMERFKKLRRSKDRQQLIESSDDES
ncbi:DUF4604 domain-containing protein [Caenorhabditis elegans]|uniref:DUF4604 domain-containing protein n=1 Tax=Caenorhabditis elegans TaxID=6239 RepID=Q7YTK9_CAEEL|nr:DUF4604 domain-containing protein [Caenorhabditis elegans]CAE17914.1 DUF4604 domain-containing protein [Caenorhabditis elegans]|eukprot:NP_001024867.1 Uncharacterized protein CELE_T01B4.3 [Caenorhabditis elegans]